MMGGDCRFDCSTGGAEGFALHETPLAAGVEGAVLHTILQPRRGQRQQPVKCKKAILNHT